MKMAVIIGVAHMSMGIVTKGLNALYFKNMMIFWTEVVTGLIILIGLFGWMDILIFSKWTFQMNPYSLNPTMQARINEAPSIITVMINNFLAGGNQEVPIYGQSQGNINFFFFGGQKQISEMLIVFVFLCIPIMLCFKPCAMICCKYGQHHDEVAPA
jgi:V-type H+-transporting ATPase subunit a